ncbi:MAG TPA: hypothetical protein VN258_01045, partial [Mobilitalea sp.]|nr:hypothetical protein [Mobilitalea sp.]
GNKLVIKNNTNLKLEYVKTNFINADDSINNSKTANNIDSHKTSTLTQKTIDLTGTNANLEVRFKFEGKDELFTDAGIFNDKLNGNVKITFTQKDDNTINLTVKASNGLLTSNSIDCNEHYTINLKNGVISE